MPGSPERTLIVPPGDVPPHSLAAYLIAFGPPPGAETWQTAWLASFKAWLKGK
jgi:hypothetical protein